MGVFRDICEFNGYDFSEDFLFGLSGGLCFVYMKLRKYGMPAFTTGADIRNFLDNVCSALNIEYETKTTTSIRRAWDNVKHLIDQDIPVPLQADMYCLPYLMKERKRRLKTIKVPRRVPAVKPHFGGHAIVMVGYDDENVEAYIYDAWLQEIQTISYEDLQRARSSKFKPFPPNNRLWKFTFPETLPPIEETVRKSFKKTISNFYDGPGFTGIGGERKLAKEIVKWPKIFSEKELIDALWVGIYVFGLFMCGTGGGMFRDAYSKFLVEASRILEEDKLRRIAEIFSEASDNWAGIAQIAKEAIDIQDKTELEKALKIASDRIMETSYLEEDALNLLKEII